MSEWVQGLTDPLGWVVPSTAAQYRTALEIRAQDLSKYGSVQQLLPSLWAGALFLVLRAVIKSTFWKIWRHRRQHSLARTDALKIEEDLWLATGNTALLVWGWQLLLSSKRCTVWSTSGCTEGWPLIPTPPALLAFYNVEVGWYLHLIGKHFTGLGLPDQPMMLAHHGASLALLLISYGVSFHYVGLLVLCVLNAANPVLAISKLTHHLHLRTARVVLFKVFAVVFFVTRVCMFPLTIMNCTIVQVRRNIPDVMQHFRAYYLAANCLLSALYVMQLTWMLQIIRMIRAAKAAGGEVAEPEPERTALLAAAAAASDDDGAAAAAPAATASTASAAAVAAATHDNVDDDDDDGAPADDGERAPADDSERAPADDSDCAPAGLLLQSLKRE